jgi:seryl-tRNA(Sec) selenium transferase
VLHGRGQVVPNPYLAQGATLVAYSAGKILRGPQGCTPAPPWG